VPVCSVSLRDFLWNIQLHTAIRIYFIVSYILLFTLGPHLMYLLLLRLKFKRNKIPEELCDHLHFLSCGVHECTTLHLEILFSLLFKRGIPRFLCDELLVWLMFESHQICWTRSPPFIFPFLRFLRKYRSFAITFSISVFVQRCLLSENISWKHSFV